MDMNYSLLINGRKVIGEQGSFSVINPATGSALGECPAASAGQLEEAIAAASTAFATWQYTPESNITEMMNAIADKIEAHADELARIITLEQGKPLGLAQIEVGASAAWTRATAAMTLPVKTIEDSENRLIELHRKPLGVIGSITPWNWPLMIAIWHIVPAIRTRNTLVIKPSSFTPFNTLRLVELINEVLPAGVVNVVTGERDIGNTITGHPTLRKVVFTGSTPTGQTIMRNAASNLKRLTLELGGNDAGIVLPGTDLEKIAPAIFQTAFLNMGQTCAALKRLYVHESQYEEMCQRLSSIAKSQVVGSGLDEGVTFGPIQNKKQFDLVCTLVDDARESGARILTGGAPLNGPGYFYPPTIVADARDGMRLVNEEQFGPVLPVIRYTDLEDAITQANASESALGGSVWGNDIELASQIALRFECGTAWVNNHAEVLPHCPFGGCKMSGFGLEFGEEGLLEYTAPQLLNINRN
ncbi:aldehyde dehydrogenase family protein [Nitrincola alkalilacustris]|uniref:aldehyde dehydrogenase family protein n=1 Tax=Nitrincola alkalilacustris TaxID=1571224 RepID=UPI00124D7BB7|nr:aldehyde dehydrogenase family protein [Nitrincola alkalilacustris]